MQEGTRTGSSRVTHLILVLPGLAVAVGALVMDFLAWDPTHEPDFGRLQLLGLGCGLLVAAGGYLLPRFLPDRYVYVLARVVFSCGLFVATLALVDFACRVFDPFGLEYHPEITRYNLMMVDHADVPYIHSPGLRDVFQGVEVSINSEGFRWDEYSIEKSDGRRRLLVLGDSVVFGWGVAQDKIFPAVLRDFVRQSGLDWEVISAGVGSWNTRTEVDWFSARGLDYEPDIVLMNIVPNDIEPTVKVERARGAEADREPGTARSSASGGERGGQGPPGRSGVLSAAWRDLVKVSYLCGYAQDLRRKKEFMITEPERYGTDSPRWRVVANALSDMQSICERNGVLLLVSFPYTDARRPFSVKYKKCLDDLGVTYTTLPAVGRNTNSRVDGHPNAVGHRLMGEHLWEFLQPYFQ